MKLMSVFKEQLVSLGPLKRVWLTSFNINTDFIETYLLPALLDMDPPRNRMDYESFQFELTQRQIDLRIFCDKRALTADHFKRTAMPIYPVAPRSFAGVAGVGADSLFHPKVIYLEDEDGNMVLGAGSANLTVSGWGRNQEVFSFHAVSNADQYRQVKRFFEVLFEQLDVDLDFGVKRKFVGNDHNWQFVHSFQKKRPFVERLFEGGEFRRLTVWSPYLSENLPMLLERLRETAGIPSMNLTLVPDRIEGRYIRTPWTDALAASLAKGDIRFCAHPVKRDEAIELTHAKVWLASGGQLNRLAIGSWNFTHSGASSFEHRNIEAGVLIDCDCRPCIAGPHIDVTADDFASPNVLKDDALDLEEELPFDVQVSFNWQQGLYQVLGQLYEKGQGAGYQMLLPGIATPILLNWRKNRKGNSWPLQSIEQIVPDNEALLSDHSYAIVLNGKTVYRGLILELGQSHRRAQGYETLSDLLDSLVNQTEPGSNDKLVLRDSLRNSGGPDEDLPIPAMDTDVEALSYFRVFTAFEYFRQRLRDVDTYEQLEKWLFTYPGCVQELAAKVRERIDVDPLKVFNWFLAQEINALYQVALERYECFREPYSPKHPPVEQWQTLQVALPPLPDELAQRPEYIHCVEQECAYVSE